jgi:hypothetical protein
MPRILNPSHALHHGLKKPPRYPRKNSSGSTWSRSHGSHESESASLATKPSTSTSCISNESASASFTTNPSTSCGSAVSTTPMMTGKEDSVLSRSSKRSIFLPLSSMSACEEQQGMPSLQPDTSCDWGHYVDFTSPKHAHARF